MPRYFTHLYNSEVVCDDYGQEFVDMNAAHDAARRTASELIAEHIVMGTLVDLSHRLDIVDDHGRVVTTVKFADLFESGKPPAPQKILGQAINDV